MRSLKIIMILTTLVLAGCSPKYYTPNTQNVPLLTEKGEANITLAGNVNQVEFQGSYAVSENIGIIANGGLFIPSDQDNGNGGSGKFVELGAGYFTPIDENFVFETYGILGFGSVENHLRSTINEHPLTSGDISANVFRYGIQPNFGYKSKHFSAAVSSRLVNLTYSKVEGDLIFDNDNQVNYLQNNNSNFMLEPALTLRGGFEQLKLQMQFGYSFNLSNSDFRQDTSYFTVGLNYNFK